MDRKVISNIVGARLQRVYFTPSENKETEGIHSLLLIFDNGYSISLHTADRNFLREMITAESLDKEEGDKKLDTPQDAKLVDELGFPVIAAEDVPSMPECKESKEESRPCIYCGWAMGERVGEPACDHFKQKNRKNMEE